MEQAPKMISLDTVKVANRMKLLESTKPLAWRTYMVLLAAKDPKVMIDFTKPASEIALLELNRIFDIDAAVFFTVSDEEIIDNFEVFLRPEQ